MSIHLHPKPTRGFIAIFTVIALLSFSVSVMLATNYLSIDQSQAGLVVTQGEAALQLANGCAENALLLGRRNETYTGGTTPLLEGTCEVAIEKEGSTWTLTITGTKDSFARTLVVTAEYNPGPPAALTPTSWLEQ